MLLARPLFQRWIQVRSQFVPADLTVRRRLDRQNSLGGNPIAPDPFLDCLIAHAALHG